MTEEGEVHRNRISSSDVMLEVQGPMQSHVSTGEISEKSYVFTKEHLEGFCQLQSEDNAIKNTTFYSGKLNTCLVGYIKNSLHNFSHNYQYLTFLA